MASRWHRETKKSEREFAQRLALNITTYWRERKFDIKASIDSPVVIQTLTNKHRAPVFAIRSNIGPYGYPPKKAGAK